MVQPAAPGDAYTGLIASLRPCPHQVAGHLFENGKAGSLVDDRGHFYKPLQRGPRGDRERAFYEGLAAALAAESAQQRQQQQRAAGAAPPSPCGVSLQRTPEGPPAPRRSPTVLAAAAAAATSPFAQSARPPWLGLSLRALFPSFSDRGQCQVAAGTEVAQRDALGLLGSMQLRELEGGRQEVGGGQAGAAEPRQQQQQQQQQPKESAGGDDGQSSRQVPEGPPANSAAAQRKEALRRRWAEEQARARAGAAEAGTSPLGCSPDSDEGAEATGEHLMGGYSAPHPSDREPEQEGQRQQQQQRHGPPERAPCRGEAEGAGQQQQQPERGGAGPRRGQATPARPLALRRLSAGAEAYLDPAQATAAALLGQPAFDGEVPAASSAPAALASRQAAVLRAAAQAAEAAEAAEAASTASSSSEGEGAEGGAGPPLQPVLPFSVRNAPLLRVVPRFYGVHEEGGGGPGSPRRLLLELEDLARHYRRPCIIDIKVGFRTWYRSADPDYIQRCKEKDAATTQAALGFKICGMQVYRASLGGYWRASKRWCKTLPAALVDRALASFAHNERGLRPADVYGGPAGAAAQLAGLEAWFAWQREFAFYSSSLLILYEGDAAGPADVAVKVRLVDFAHTFRRAGDGRCDANFLAGLRAVIARLAAVARLEAAEQLPML